MKTLTSCLAILSTSIASHAEAGRAKVDWIAESNGLESGKIRSIVRMEIESPWHIYWLNPGEGGLPVSIKWKLPEGWSTGEIQHPAPLRFMTGELVSFGYKGTVLFPIDITTPSPISSPITLLGTVTWLACNDDACVPGSAEISLTLSPQDTPAANAKLIEAAYNSLPAPIPSSTLTIEDAGDSWKLQIQLPPTDQHKLSDYEIFPLPENFIAATAKPRFTKTENTWTAIAPKSPYFSGKIPPITLVLTSPNKPALRFSYSAP